MSRDVIAILALRGGTLFPVFQTTLKALREQGFGDQVVMRCSGHISQLNVALPPGPDLMTPQVASPEQDLNSVTGGSPARTTLKDEVYVTVDFATGQANS